MIAEIRWISFSVMGGYFFYYIFLHLRGQNKENSVRFLWKRVYIFLVTLTLDLMTNLRFFPALL